MSEATVSSEIIKKTQSTLGKYVKKPPLNDKLLKKPPFRFLHDVINVVIKDTGYLKGLYTSDELNSDNIKDRDGKISFLQKLIDALKATSEQKISVKPSKIVAGLEPEKTNELLQVLAYCIEKNATKKNDDVPPLLSIPKNKEKPAKQSNKTTTEKSKTDINAKSTRTTGKISSQPPPKEMDKAKNRRTEVTKPLTDKNAKPNDVKAKSKTKNKEPIKQKSIEKISRSNSEEKKTALTAHKEDILKSKDIVEEVAIDIPIQEQKSINGDITNSNDNSLPDGIVNINDMKPLDEFVAIIDEEAQIRRKEKLKNSGKHKQRRMSSTENGLEESNGDDSLKNTSNDENNPNLDNKPKSSKPTASHTRNTTAEANEKDKSKRPPYVRQPSTDLKNNVSRTSLRPPSVRPASARPAAPRRRDKNIEIVLQPDETIKLGEINIKMETFTADDDGENLIIIEDPTIPSEDILNSNKTSGDTYTTDGEEQGHLVQTILETQKEFSNITNDAVNGLQNKSESEWEQSTSSQRQSSANQMEGLRDSIQKLTRSINPLGKLMDFLQEDIDSMQRELQMWRESYQETLIELNKEKSLTANAIEPLKLQLTQIIASVKEHKDIIDTTRANILLNEQKILKLVAEI